jgi:hypothetical protein
MGIAIENNHNLQAFLPEKLLSPVSNAFRPLRVVRSQEPLLSPLQDLQKRNHGLALEATA